MSLTNAQRSIFLTDNGKKKRKPRDFGNYLLHFPPESGGTTHKDPHTCIHAHTGGK
jgi:hypothetical protein